MTQPRQIEWAYWEQFRYDTAGWCKIARDRRAPIIVMDDKCEEVAILVTHRIASYVHHRLQRTDIFVLETIDDPDVFEQLFDSLDHYGMVMLDSYDPTVKWVGLITPDQLELVFEANPDWRERFDWRGIEVQQAL